MITLESSKQSNKALKLLKSLNRNALTPDGFEDCVVGVVLRGDIWVALVSRPLVVSKLVKTSAMNEEEAEEYFDFNIECAYYGVNTPLFLSGTN